MTIRHGRWAPGRRNMKKQAKDELEESGLMVTALGRGGCTGGSSAAPRLSPRTPGRLFARPGPPGPKQFLGYVEVERRASSYQITPECPTEPLGDGQQQTNFRNVPGCRR